jgi:cellulose synthase/poly-beta-1,6-N-acetylglucosamine synthase-like glycosyltransferase
VIVQVIGGVSLAIWLYLLLGRGGFWRGAERDDNLLPGQADTAAISGWPDVVAVVPARDEAEVIARSVSSLLRQTYSGRFSVVVVDDGSSDGTGEVARAAAEGAHAADRLTVLRGSEPPPGWTGKLWAMQRGFEYVQAEASSADFVLFTDADIAYQAPDALQTLVGGRWPARRY